MELLKTLRQVHRTALFCFFGLEFLLAGCTANKEIRTAMPVNIYEQFVDINNDGHTDRVYVGNLPAFNWKFKLAAKLGDGENFKSPIGIYNFPFYPRFYSIANFDEAPAKDLLYLYCAPNNRYNLVLVPNIRQGEERVVKSFANAPLSIIVNDVNGDGFQDIIFIDSKERLYVMKNDGRGNFSKPMFVERINAVNLFRE